MSAMLMFVLLLVLAAEFVNGWTDAPNAIATVVSTKVMKPRTAVMMAVVFNILGALSGTAVAITIGKGIVDPAIINYKTIAASMIAIVSWSTIAYRWGIPTSESHELVASLMGAGLATAGPKVLLWSGWEKIFLGLFFATVLGFFGGYFVSKIVYYTSRYRNVRKMRKLYGRLQILSSGLMAFSHGSNDGQKFIGVFALCLMMSTGSGVFSVPLWVIFVCAIVMGIGTMTGGWKIIRTMGMRLVQLKTHQGFSAETGASAVILAASYFGIPLSTTHAINTSIMGVGAADNKRAVDWRVAGEIAKVWILTFPVCAIIGYCVALFINLF